VGARTQPWDQRWFPQQAAASTHTVTEKFTGRSVLTHGAERRTPEEVAQDYDLPVEAVHEAIDYAMHNQELLEAERAREEARLQQLSLHKSPFVPTDTLQT
jgi:hypothetical protein